MSEFLRRFEASTVLRGPDSNPSTNFTIDIAYFRKDTATAIITKTVGEQILPDLHTFRQLSGAVEFGQGGTFDRRT